MDPSTLEEVGGVPYCLGCAPIARNQWRRMQSGKRQEEELARRQSDEEEREKLLREKQGIYNGILYFEYLVRMLLSYAWSLIECGLWMVSGWHPLAYSLFLGLILADATSWVFRAFFEIPRKKVKPFVELGIYMLLFHFWYSSGRGIPEDPAMRGIVAMVFIGVFVSKMSAFAIGLFHGGKIWGRNPWIDDED